MTSKTNILKEEEFIKKSSLLNTGLIMVIVTSSILIFIGFISGIVLMTNSNWYVVLTGIIVLVSFWALSIPILVLSCVALADKKTIRHGLIIASAVLSFVMSVIVIESLIFPALLITGGVLALCGKGNDNQVVDINKNFIRAYK